MLPTGTSLGPYQILALLGKGGMGEVYRARDTRLGRDVAVKVIAADQTRGDTRRFEQEARAAGALNHPNVCAVFDIGTHEGSPFVVMELLEGMSLRARLNQGPIPARKAIDWAAQAAHGLAAAHEKGIVHRDLKPENLFLTKDGRIKVLDFGLAKLTRPELLAPEGEDALTVVATQSGAMMGTAGYMAPEQVRGETADHRADLFALGSVTYELLTGKRAFAGETLYETSYRIVHDDPPPLSSSGREILPGLEAIVRRCLEKSPEERFQSAKDFAFDLSVLAAEVARTPGASGAGSAAKRSRTRPALLILAAVALAGLGVVASRALWRAPIPAPVSYQRLTFRQGSINRACFAPDGQIVVYAARWGGSSSEVFTLRLGSPESRPLGISDARLLGVSSRGDLAVQLQPRMSYGTMKGTLAQVALGGGEPRALRDGVFFADWTPDGSQLAIVVRDTAGWQLQMPVGATIVKSHGQIARPRVAPDGAAVAYLRDGIDLIVPGEPEQMLAPLAGACYGMVWHPRTRELWYAEYDSAGATCLRAVSVDRRQRLLLRLPGFAMLEDIATDGRVLLAMATSRSAMMVLAPGQTEEHDLSWLDGSLCSDLSPDGQLLVFDEGGIAGGRTGAVYLRRTDGSSAVRLGAGSKGALSSDRQWVVVFVPGAPSKLRLLPVGAGEPRDVDTGDIVLAGAQWFFPDDRRLLFNGRRGDAPLQFFAVPLGGGTPQAITPPGWLDWARMRPLSPDGRFVVAENERHSRVFPTDGGPSFPVPGLASGEVVMGWTEDSRGLYVFRRGEVPVRVYRLDVATGRRELWNTLGPADRAGVALIDWIIIAPDGRTYAYEFTRWRSDLYQVTGLE